MNLNARKVHWDKQNTQKLSRTREPRNMLVNYNDIPLIIWATDVT